MRLKMFIWHNPATQEPEKVYQFPWSSAEVYEISLYGRNMFTKKPMQRPIFSIPEIYLTEIKGQFHTATIEEIRMFQSQLEPEV